MTAPENAGANQTGRFRKGQSGNPAGKPRGTRHKTTLAMEALLDGEAEALTRKAVERALDGDSVALRLCLERIIPPRRDRPISFTLPKIETIADIVPAHAAIAAAVASGEVTPTEGLDCSRMIDAMARAIEITDLEERLTKLENQANGAAS